MRRRNERMTVTLMTLLVCVAACTGGDDPASLAQRACERLDECNALTAGQSVEDCVADAQHDLDALAPGARHDTEKLVEDCLEFQTCSAYLSCLGDGSPGAPPMDPPATEPPPPPPPPPVQQFGQFTFEWSIVRGGVPTTCADVGADTVQLHSFLNGTEFRDIFDCSAFRGITGQLPVGAYTLFITINAGDTELGRSQSQSATLGPGQVVPIQGVTWSVN
jgi:hypothetical protein